MFKGFLRGNKRIFLDYASTTPVLPEVKKEMDKYWSSSFHNPSAIYEEGRSVRKDLEEYRARAARALVCGKKDIIFTSGGTESANLAVLGTVAAFREKFPNERPHVVISSIEHPAVSEAAREAERRGAEVSVWEVDSEGIVSPESLKNLLKPNTCLVSVILANNEIGTIEPMANIGRVVREVRKTNNSEFPYLHTDASQAPNYVRVDAEALNIDLMTLDGSKIYGPKGVGVLVARPTTHLKANTWGGDQERGLRAGTENMPLVAGFTRALIVALENRDKEAERLRELRNFFINKLKESDLSLEINSSKEKSLPNIVSVSVPGTLAEFLVLKLDAKGVMVSVGSACANLGDKENGSRAIRAIGKPELSESTVRFSFGKFTTQSEIKKALKTFIDVLKHDKIFS